MINSPVQELDAVRLANCAFSAWASWPFWRWKSPDAAAGAAAAVVATAAAVVAATAEVTATVAASVATDATLTAVAAEVAGAAAAAPPAAPTPGFWVMLTSCTPSGMGPAGFAGHEPGGVRGVVWPKGIVPAPPTAVPPTKVVSSALWNWHWNRPFSSAFFGACWQYGTA